MTDSAGTVVWAADYKPFGEATVTVNTITNNLRFPGQYYDQETRLHYNYFRDYNPAVGRYLTWDPALMVTGDPRIPYLLNFILDEPLSLHPYVYVANQPIAWIDPEGLKRGGTSAGRRPNNRRIRDFMDNASEIPDFNMGNPNCVYRAVTKCVKYVCGCDPTATGPWFVADVTRSCWCAEEKSRIRV